MSKIILILCNNFRQLEVYFIDVIFLISIDGINDIGHQQRGILQENSYRRQFGSHQDTSSHNQFSNIPMTSNGGIGTSKGGNFPGMFQGQHKINPGAVFPTAQMASQPSPNMLHHMNNTSNPQQQYNPPWSTGSGGSSGRVLHYSFFGIP